MNLGKTIFQFCSNTTIVLLTILIYIYRCHISMNIASPTFHIFVIFVIYKVFPISIISIFLQFSEFTKPENIKILSSIASSIIIYHLLLHRFIYHALSSIICNSIIPQSIQFFMSNFSSINLNSTFLCSSVQQMICYH